jgi:hypothetical protein
VKAPKLSFAPQTRRRLLPNQAVTNILFTCFYLPLPLLPLPALAFYINPQDFPLYPIFLFSSSHSTTSTHQSNLSIHHIPTKQIFIKMESIKQAANYVSESVKGAASTTSKEANKEVAKDNNANIGTR